MTEEFAAIWDRACHVRLRYLAGEITEKEARAQLKEYRDAFNQKAEEIAQKYHQKPKRLRVGDFLKYAP